MDKPDPLGTYKSISIGGAKKLKFFFSLSCDAQVKALYKIIIYFFWFQNKQINFILFYFNYSF